MNMDSDPFDTSLNSSYQLGTAPTRTSRQPHLGMTLLVLGIFAIMMFVVSAVGIAVGHALHLLPKGTLAPYGNPRLIILIEFLAYALTALASYPLLRAIWHRPVDAVLALNWPTAQRYAGRLVAFGFLLAILAQVVTAKMSMPKDMPIDSFFTHPLDVWLMAFFGTLIAPAVEEIFFRGFLLRSFAIAFDWSGQFMGSDRKLFWQTTDSTSRAAWMFGALLSSLLFATMHAAQLGWAWNAVAVLTVVGLLFAYVRIRFDSVLASSLVHMGYNGFLFVLVFFATDGYRHLDKLKH